MATRKKTEMEDGAEPFDYRKETRVERGRRFAKEMAAGPTTNVVISDRFRTSDGGPATVQLARISGFSFLGTAGETMEVPLEVARIAYCADMLATCPEGVPRNKRDGLDQIGEVPALAQNTFRKERENPAKSMGEVTGS